MGALKETKWQQIDESLILLLKKKAKIVRRRMIEMLWKAKGGHFGGSLSSVDILVALYFHILKVNPQDPDWEDRDRFILSKGHTSAALCPTLAERGYFSVQLLDTFNQSDSPFGMHPDMCKIAGCDMSTGSLGHGLPVGVGMALSGKLDAKNYKVFVLLGDGELQEGSIWEAMMAAGHYKLDNLVAIVDRNKIELDGATEEIMALEPLSKKWEDFGWSVKEIDGHNMKEILEALKKLPLREGKPSVIIAHTIKGKGVSFMENTHDWHYGKIRKEEFEKALVELGEIK